MDPANPATETPAAEATPPVTAAEGKPSAFEPITSQEQLNAILADRLRRERSKFGDYAELKAKAARLDDIEQASKTELEKATEANVKLAAELEALKLTQLRTEIAVEKGLAPSAARFLTGTTREQIEADVNDLVKLAGTTPKPAPGSVPGIGNAPETRNLSIRDQISAAEAAGDKNLVATLKATWLGTVKPTS